MFLRSVVEYANLGMLVLTRQPVRVEAAKTELLAEPARISVNIVKHGAHI